MKGQIKKDVSAQINLDLKNQKKLIQKKTLVNFLNFRHNILISHAS